MTGVTAAWERIEGWMARHAPRNLDALAGPASIEEVRAAEAELGLDFPADLVASLLRHDGVVRGATVLPLGLMPVASIVEIRAMLMGVADEVDGFAVRPWDDEPWWHEQWLPVAAVEGYYDVIDLRTGDGYGRLGTGGHDVGHFGNDWPSFNAFLAEVAVALESGRALESRQEERAFLAVDGELWWDAADATDLLGAPLRPAPATR